jgi:crotonobetainyl-CoA:carnitine CoA-transferase CaiB-like acyl-CoA transferase
VSRLREFLKGIRILDLSRHLPGPLLTLFLADMGADVLKIEPPAGDELRVLGPPGPNGRSVYFDAVNAGKTTRRMDLRDATVRAEFLELVRGSDILIESFRPGVMTRLGVGYETLTAVNRRLIYCSLNGFGVSGPLAQTPAHDVNYLALAGALDHNADFFDPPVADCAGSLFAAVAVLGALHQRAADSNGCHLDVALGDAVMPLQLFQLAELALTGATAPPRAGLLNGGAACYRIYETADRRRVSLGALEPKFWRAFCAAANRPDWERRHGDPLPQDALAAEISAMFAGLTLVECNKRFAAANCCFAPVLDLSEAIQSTHVRNRGVVHRTKTGSLQALFPAVVDGEPPEPRAEVSEKFEV